MKLAWLMSGSGVSKSPSRMIGLRPGGAKSARRRYPWMKVQLTHVDSIVPRKASRFVSTHLKAKQEESLLVSDAASPPDSLSGFHLGRRQDALPAHLPVFRRSVQPEIKSLTKSWSTNRKHYEVIAPHLPSPWP